MSFVVPPDYKAAFFPQNAQQLLAKVNRSITVMLSMTFLFLKKITDFNEFCLPIHSGVVYLISAELFQTEPIPSIILN